MKRFLMDLFARHEWSFSEPERQCAICGRLDVLEVDQDEWGETFEWIRIVRGDATRHWAAVVPA